MKTMAYYPGCSLHSTATEMDESFKATAEALDLRLLEIPNWVCCGNSSMHATDRLLAAALPVAELAKVEQLMKLDSVAVPCAACFNRFAAGNHEMRDPEKAADILAVVGHPYEGTVAVRNLVDVYHDEIGLEQLAAHVVRPFADLNVACYYGCLLARPPKVILADDPEYPTHMEEVVATLGCRPLDWSYKTDCCGAGLALCEQDMVGDLTARIVGNAHDCGAEAIVVACPLCQINLDTRQDAIAAKRPGWQRLPVIYLSQMVGRAIGVEDARLGLDKHMVGTGYVLD